MCLTNKRKRNWIRKKDRVLDQIRQNDFEIFFVNDFEIFYEMHFICISDADLVSLNL